MLLQSTDVVVVMKGGGKFVATSNNTMVALMVAEAGFAQSKYASIINSTREPASHRCAAEISLRSDTVCKLRKYLGGKFASSSKNMETWNPPI